MVRFSVFPGTQLLALECPLPFRSVLHFQVRSQTSQWLPLAPWGSATPLLRPWLQAPGHWWSYTYFNPLGAPCPVPPEDLIQPVNDFSANSRQAALLPALSLFLQTDSALESMCRTWEFSFYHEERCGKARSHATQRWGEVLLGSMEAFGRRVHVP